MNKKILVVLSGVLILLGFILSSVLCQPVTSDEYTMDYYVDAFAPVITSLIAFILAAVCVCSLINICAQEKGVQVNPVLIGIGMGIFGLFYALSVVYKDAANTLNQFYDTWGAVDKLAGTIPETAGKFNLIANRYGMIMWVGIAIILFGAYRVKKAIDAKVKQNSTETKNLIH